MLKISISSRNPHGVFAAVISLIVLLQLHHVTASVIDCYFVYQEVIGGTEIPGVPTAVREKNVPDCPPGLYEEGVWPLDGCVMNCPLNARSDCLAFGYVTEEKAVLHMSCAATVSSTNPDGSNVQNCEENSRWIELTVKQPSGGNNETVVVSDYQCDTCGFIADCIPPFFENYTGSLAATTSETTAPESSAIGMAWRTPVTLIMAFVTSCVALS